VLERVEGILSTARGIGAEGDLFFGFIHTDADSTSVKDAVDQALDSLRGRGHSDLPTVELRVHRNIPPNLPAVRAAQKPLRRVFSILFENAVQAMANQIGELTVEAHRHGPRLRVVVSDTGVGISEKHLEEIFKPNVSFWKDDGGPAPAPGGRLGFGLWWARAYLHHIAGSIAVESSAGSGSRFIVEMPIA
jgi:signal transduction histidine kinase